MPRKVPDNLDPTQEHRDCLPSDAPPQRSQRSGSASFRLQQLILRSIPDLLMLVRKDGTYLEFMNGGDVTLFRQGKELDLMNIYDCLPPDLAEQRMALIEQALQTGEQQNHEYVIHLQGIQHYEEARIIPVELDEVLILVRDITEQKQLEETLRIKAKQEHILNQIFSEIRRSLDLQHIFESTVTEVKQHLETDRVLFYRFEPDWSGVVVAESVETPWRTLQGHRVMDHCLAQNDYIDAYLSGRVHHFEDIQTADLSPCHRDLLQQWQVRANLLVPVKQGEQLHGLFAAQHCRAPRQWKDWEVHLMQQIADHLAIAIHQGELYQQLQWANEELARLATTDSLTQVANRLRFDAYLTREWYRMRRERQPLSLILFDIDYFKQYNDYYGHLEGDDCLVKVAQTAAKLLKRPTDFMARYGGEEFAILLSHTSMAGACIVAETVRKAIYDLQIPHAGSALEAQVVTISLGIACIIPELDDAPKRLVSKADKALYTAKRSGRNCLTQAS